MLVAMQLVVFAAGFALPPRTISRWPSTRAPSPEMAASGLFTGEQVAPEALAALGINNGERAIVAFYCRDDGFECKKELMDMQERANSFRQYGCEVIAVRGDGMQAVQEGTAAQYPALRFVVDAGDAIRTSFRMRADGLRGGDRHTYLVDAGGRVQGQINNYADPFCHAQMALRTLKAMDDPVQQWDAASEAVDKKAAAYQKLFDDEREERAARQAQVKADLEARQAAIDEGRTPEPAANFFEGFFGAFKK